MYRSATANSRSPTIFTSDPAWARAVSEMILAAGSTWPDAPTAFASSPPIGSSGHAALGCYRVSFGFESGNDESSRLSARAARRRSKGARRYCSRRRDRHQRLLLLGMSSDSGGYEGHHQYARSPVRHDEVRLGDRLPGTLMFKISKRGLLPQSGRLLHLFRASAFPIAPEPKVTERRKVSGAKD